MRLSEEHPVRPGGHYVRSASSHLCRGTARAGVSLPVASCGVFTAVFCALAVATIVPLSERRSRDRQEPSGGQRGAEEPNTHNPSPLYFNFTLIGVHIRRIRSG